MYQVSHEVELLIQYSHASRCDGTQLYVNITEYYECLCLFEFISPRKNQNGN